LVCVEYVPLRYACLGCASPERYESAVSI